MAAEQQRGSGLRFTLAGFPVAVPANTLLGVALIAFLWLPQFASDSVVKQWVMAIIFALLLLASVLVHELAHALVARRFGHPVLGVTLWAFGGYTSYQPRRNSPGREAAIAAAGPGATLAIAAVAYLALRVVPTGGDVADILAAVVVANIFVGAFNLLPGLPLDGGSILSSAIWAVTRSRDKGQRAAAYAGMALAALLVAAPFAVGLRTGVPPTLGLILVSLMLGAFLFIGARSALVASRRAQLLDETTAADLASPALLFPGAGSIAELRDALGRREAGAPPPVVLAVDETGRVRAVVLPAALSAVPPQSWADTTVAAVSRTVPECVRLPGTATAGHVATVLRTTGGVVLVTEPETGLATGVILPQGDA